MNGLMMDYQLTLPPILRRAETFFGDKEVVTRLPDKSFHRYTYRDRREAACCRPPELGRGDRVATL
jgi:fatty-acyl-CoA synthase